MICTACGKPVARKEESRVHLFRADRHRLGGVYRPFGEVNALYHISCAPSQAELAELFAGIIKVEEPQPAPTPASTRMLVKQEIVHCWPSGESFTREDVKKATGLQHLHNIMAELEEEKFIERNGRTRKLVGRKPVGPEVLKYRRRLS